MVVEHEELVLGLIFCYPWRAEKQHLLGDDDGEVFDGAGECLQLISTDKVSFAGSGNSLYFL